MRDFNVVLETQKTENRSSQINNYNGLSLLILWSGIYIRLPEAGINDVMS